MSRRSTLILVIALIGAPVAVAGVEAIAFYRANRSTHQLQSSGLTREYRLHVPAAHDPSRPTPLVISLHGAAMWPAAQQRTSQWDRVAEREGFIVAYPAAFSGRGPRIWQVTAGPSHRRDVTFISDLIDELSRTYNIDAQRIYANGFSNGGGMSFVLSCTLSDRIAAIGLVDAALTLPFNWCRDDRPIPMIAFHGNSGEAAPYKGGSSWVSLGRRIFQDVEGFTAGWARRNHCDGPPRIAPAASDVTRIAYEDCKSNAPVILFRLEGGGHTWPGGGHIAKWFVGETNRNIDASAVMWDFFEQHPLGR